jgi:hypothetical protein
MWHGGNLAIVIAIEASTFYKKHKHKDEMRWDETMVDINMVGSNRVVDPNMVDTNGKWKTKKRW